MKKLFIFSIFTAIVAYGLLAAQGLAGQQLNLVYPQLTARINSPSTYFIGNTNPGSNVTINNKPVKIGLSGIFVTTVPLVQGKNVFVLKSSKGGQTTSKTINIKVPYSPGEVPSWPLAINPDSVSPAGSAIYSAGDIINFKVKASPGARASLTIGKVNVPMTELPPEVNTVKQQVLGEVYGFKGKPLKGIYNAVYTVKSNINLSQAPVKIHLSNKGVTRSFNTGTKISTWNPDSNPIVGIITENKAAIRTGPGDARLTPLPEGVKILLTGLENGHYKFKLGPFLEGYIPQNQVRILPAGSPVPYTYIRTIKSEACDDSVLIHIPLSARIPYQIDQSVDQKKLALYLYGAKADNDIMKYNFNNNYIYQLKWSQPYTNVYALDVLFNKNQQWGYDIYYEGSERDGSLNLVMKLKSPPSWLGNNPLAGKIIAIDPGHGGSELGSVGPGQVPEKKVNLAIANYLAKKLQDNGAKPILTRCDDSYVSIYARPDIAAANDADILVSIHNNAIPDGRDPNIDHGSSTYYYHPMGFNLAQSIHKQLLNRLHFPDFGLYYDNLALPRDHRMPSVLVEVGFMINPGEYEKLTTDHFQQDSAAAIFEGIKEFFGNYS